jgi:hypothetical protein
MNHLKSNAVAYVALFVALGGTSYAALRIPANSVGNRQLKNHSVSADKLDRSSIAGYVRDWATIDSQGRVVASHPKAHLVIWRQTGPAPGGLISWGHPIPLACFAQATTDVTPPVSYAAASVSSNGSGNGRFVGAYVLLSQPEIGVHVAVVCPQP